MRFRRTYAGMLALAAALAARGSTPVVGTAADVASDRVRPHAPSAGAKKVVPGVLEQARAARLLFGGAARDGVEVRSRYRGWNNCSARGFRRRVRSDYRSQFDHPVVAARKS